MSEPLSISQAQSLTESMERLAEIFGCSISEVLHGCATSASDAAPGFPDPVTLAAVVNGGLIGILTFMTDMSEAGRMADPNGHLTSLFRLAADTWDGVRTSSVEAGATLQ
ncbi:MULTISPECIES: hypothetical protein [unclassified Novosphingobium]|uniref:hypothetical protein n=1 Tax=unclassified Novosphingobium TaxID=2644732 RepID=UPI001357B3AE|nr:MULTISPECIES: hypothetical protein [unclassified Novosphingobium]